MHWHWHRSDWSILGWRIYRWVKLSWRRRSDPFSSSAVSAGRRVREDILLHRSGPGTASHARKACRAKKTCGALNKFLHHRVTSSTRCLCPSSRKSNNNRGAHPSHHTAHKARVFLRELPISPVVGTMHHRRCCSWLIHAMRLDRWIQSHFLGKAYGLFGPQNAGGRGRERRQDSTVTAVSYGDDAGRPRLSSDFSLAKLLTGSSA